MFPAADGSKAVEVFRECKGTAAAEPVRIPGGYLLPPGADGSVAWQLLAVQPVLGHTRFVLVLWFVLVVYFRDVVVVPWAACVRVVAAPALEAISAGSAKARLPNWMTE